MHPIQRSATAIRLQASWFLKAGFAGLYHNTVFLDTGSDQLGTSALWTDDQTQVDLRNDILIKPQAPASLWYTTASGLRLTSTTNLKQQHLLCRVGAEYSLPISYRGLHNDGVLLGGGESPECASALELTPFINVLSRPFDLHMDPAIISQTNGGGALVGYADHRSRGYRRTTETVLGGRISGGRMSLSDSTGSSGRPGFTWIRESAC